MSDYLQSLQECLTVMASLRGLEDELGRAAERCAASLKSGGKLLLCGNGGSAAEAMHLAGELVGRYKTDRAPLAAITLGTDPVIASCVGNDYKFDEIFSRQVRALGRRGDVLIAFSTSGRAANILEALKGAALALADEALLVRHTDTARIQEGHQFLMHSLMDLLEIAAAKRGLDQP